MVDCTFDDFDADALEQFLRENRRATLPQVTDNVNAGSDQTVYLRTVSQQLMGGYYSRVTVHKP